MPLPEVCRLDCRGRSSSTIRASAFHWPLGLLISLICSRHPSSSLYSMAENDVAEPQFRLTLLGDGGVGKTCALLTFVNGAFPGEYIPAIWDHHLTTIAIDSADYSIRLNDTHGGDNLAIIRDLSYSKTNVFLLCFACNRPESMASLETLWMPEILKHTPDACFIFVCTKTDLRNDSEASRTTQRNYHRDIIGFEEGKRNASRFKAKYYEISSMEDADSLSRLFTDATKLALQRSKGDKCIIL